MGLRGTGALTELLLGRNDVDELAAPAPVLELHDTGCLGEQCVVFSPSHVQPRVELRASLPDQDGPTTDTLATVSLHTQKLRVRVPTVAARPLSFFVRHNF